jgi:hypothetical protein
VRHYAFKSDCINSPKDQNKIYLHANQWLNPKEEGIGCAGAFAIILDSLHEDKVNKKGNMDGAVDNNNKKRSTKQVKSKKELKYFMSTFAGTAYAL